MSSSPFSAPGAKLTLVVGLTMTFLGFVGVQQGIGILTTHASELTAPAVSPDAEVTAAMTALMQGMATAPLFRALGVANLLASALLIVASLLLTSRARSAFWWATQALWANAAYSLGAAGIHLYLLAVPLWPLVGNLAEALARVPEAPVEPIRVAYVVASTLPHLLLAGLYVGLLRLTKREDVHRFVMREV